MAKSFFPNAKNLSKCISEVIKKYNDVLIKALSNNLIISEPWSWYQHQSSAWTTIQRCSWKGVGGTKEATQWAHSKKVYLPKQIVLSWANLISKQEEWKLENFKYMWTIGRSIILLWKKTTLCVELMISLTG